MESVSAFISQTCANLNTWQNGQHQSKYEILRWDEIQQRFFLAGSDYAIKTTKNSSYFEAISLSVSRFVSSNYYYDQTDETVANKLLSITSEFSRNANSLIARIQNGEISENDAINIINELCKLVKTSTVFQNGLACIIKQQINANASEINQNTTPFISAYKSVATNVEKTAANIITALLEKHKDFNPFSQLDANGLPNLIYTLSNYPNFITFDRIFKNIIDAITKNDDFDKKLDIAQNLYFSLGHYLTKLCDAYNPELPDTEKLKEDIEMASKILRDFVKKRHSELSEFVPIGLGLTCAIASMAHRKWSYDWEKERENERIEEKKQEEEREKRNAEFAELHKKFPFLPRFK